MQNTVTIYIDDEALEKIEKFEKKQGRKSRSNSIEFVIKQCIDEDGNLKECACKKTA